MVAVEREGERGGEIRGQRARCRIVGKGEPGREMSREVARVNACIVAGGGKKPNVSPRLQKNTPILPPPAAREIRMRLGGIIRAISWEIFNDHVEFGGGVAAASAARW